MQKKKAKSRLIQWSEKKGRIQGKKVRGHRGREKLGLQETSKVGKVYHQEEISKKTDGKTERNVDLIKVNLSNKKPTL